MASRRFHGPALKEIRELAGHNIGPFADEIGISRSYLANIEADRRQPAPDVARRIADTLGVPLASVTYVVPDSADDSIQAEMPAESGAA